MTSPDDQVASHMACFLDMLDVAFRRQGVRGGLPSRFRDAVTATPRHRFVHRFRISDGPLRDSDARPVQDLPDIYSDAVMRHVDTAGKLLLSSNSQPSYVLWLLHLLDLQPGQRVLEIGSGSGWLAAVMAHLVGESGHVTGIEIITELAEQSRADLAAVGVENVTMLAADGTLGHAPGAPFDRVMITAATWDLPTVLFEQVAEGGRALIPVELRGGGCQVTVLRREGDRFVAERAVAGWFVPLRGLGQQRAELCQPLEKLPFWGEIGGAPNFRARLPLAVGPDGIAGSAVSAFRAYLGRTEPDFTTFGDSEPREPRPWLSAEPAEPFGLVDEAARSVALWDRGELQGYGDAIAVRRLVQAYVNWATYGLPGLAGFGLEVVRTAAAPPGGDRLWVERRSGTALLWRLGPEMESWKGLLGNAP
jgi:protein-L-isoaspartate(D-aspartate) O-methyltransferase